MLARRHYDRLPLWMALRAMRQLLSPTGAEWSGRHSPAQGTVRVSSGVRDAGAQRHRGGRSESVPTGLPGLAFFKRPPPPHVRMREKTWKETMTRGGCARGNGEVMRSTYPPTPVMAGLDPAIHAIAALRSPPRRGTLAGHGVDPRVKPGDDDSVCGAESCYKTP